MDLITSSLHRLYTSAQSRYPTVLFYGDRSRHSVALTFDDGPHLRDTPRVLNVLAKYDIQATFHLLGRYAEQHQHLIREIDGCGHQLALHGYRHVPFPVEVPSRLRADLEQTRRVISEACDIPPDSIRDIRPPYGAFDKRTLAHLTEWGYRLVMWTSIPPHWMQPVSWSIRQVMESIVPGAVIVLHDGHGHGTRVAEILEAIIPRIQSLGYTFVTVAQMQEQREQLSAGP